MTARTDSLAAAIAEIDDILARYPDGICPTTFCRAILQGDGEPRPHLQPFAPMEWCDVRAEITVDLAHIRIRTRLPCHPGAPDADIRPALILWRRAAARQLQAGIGAKP